jgi:hypothetical protein
MLAEYRERLPQPFQEHIARVAEVSGWLRKEREFSFYGDIDFIPTEEYVDRDAERAIDDAQWIVSISGSVIPPVERG